MGFHLGSELSSNSVYLGRMDRQMRLCAGLKSKAQNLLPPRALLIFHVHMQLSVSF